MENNGEPIKIVVLGNNDSLCEPMASLLLEILQIKGLQNQLIKFTDNAREALTYLLNNKEDIDLIISTQVMGLCTIQEIQQGKNHLDDLISNVWEKELRGNLSVGTTLYKIIKDNPKFSHFQNTPFLLMSTISADEETTHYLSTEHTIGIIVIPERGEIILKEIKRILSAKNPDNV